MANTSLSTILVILFWGLTFSTGRKLSSLRTTTTLSSPPNDGICSSRVMTQVLEYKCKVTTQDGYILNLARIRMGESREPQILLSHGHFMSLAIFLLANNGFNVWVANTFQTKFSWHHTFLASNRSDELVAHDLPATFNYVHDLSGKNCTILVTHRVSNSFVGNFDCIGCPFPRSITEHVDINFCQMTSLTNNVAEKFIVEVFSYKHVFTFVQIKNEKKICLKFKRLKQIFFFSDNHCTIWESLNLI
ncbi:Triacylglycerol lipase 2 [Glycine soja]